MVVIPGKDQVVPPAAQRELAALLPAARVVEIAGGRHEAVLNRAGEFVTLISEFAEA